MTKCAIHFNSFQMDIDFEIETKTEFEFKIEIKSSFFSFSLFLKAMQLFANPSNRPHAQPTSPNNPFQSRRNPIISKVHIIKIQMFPIRPETVKL